MTYPSHAARILASTLLSLSIGLLACKGAEFSYKKKKSDGPTESAAFRIDGPVTGHTAALLTYVGLYCPTPTQIKWSIPEIKEAAGLGEKFTYSFPAAGTYTITAYCGADKATLAVTIVDDGKFQISGPTKGKTKEVLTYTSKNCPTEVSWRVVDDLSEVSAKKGVTYLISFTAQGTYTIEAKCGDQKATIDVTITDEERQNQNQNK